MFFFFFFGVFCLFVYYNVVVFGMRWLVEWDWCLFLFEFSFV